MNRINPVLLTCLCSLLSYGQILVNDVVGQSGDEIANPDITINHTSGELVSSTINNTQITLTQGFQQTAQLLYISPRAMLQGASVESTLGSMRDDLRIGNYLPNISPDNNAIKSSSDAFSVANENAIVDWVMVKLRNSNNKVISEKPALIQKDGDVVSADGVSALQFTAQNNEYHIEINHRNHLGIMTKNTLTLSSITKFVDFTDASVLTYGNFARVHLGNGFMALWAGDANNDHSVRYAGTSPDPASILAYVLNSPQNFLNLSSFPISGYSNLDVDMNGFVQYTGINPDTPLILQNVLSYPGNFLGLSTWPIQEQLPSN